MKNTFRSTLMAAFFAALALGTAHAQEAAPAAGDAGAITNSQTTTTTTTTNTGIAPAGEVVAVDGDTTIEGTTQLANTGGEPLMFVVAGFALAGGALLLRRKVAA